MYNVGLVLSGGGARGFAHLGVIKALNEKGIFPDVVSGTSAGAIAGVLYCDGYSPEEILKIMTFPSRLNAIRPTVPREGLLQISGITKILETHLHAKTFEDLKIPFFTTATDLNNGKAISFSKGELINPVVASSSIPVLFKPVIINGIHYVDGGVMDNLPIKPIAKKCRLIIGSHVNPVGYESSITNLIQIAERTFNLSMSREVVEKGNEFDILIAPEELRNYGILDSDKGEEVFQIGYQATLSKLKDSETQKIISAWLTNN